MKEQEVFATVRLALLELLSKFGHDTVKVVRSNNLVQSGRVEGPTIYMARGTTTPRGHPRDVSYWDRNKGRMVYKNSQVNELEIIFEAMLEQNCVTDERVGDLLNLASRLMQTSLFINMIGEKSVRVLRIDTNRHTFVTNDRDQYEAVPVLSCIFVYTQTLESEAPLVSSYKLKIKRV